MKPEVYKAAVRGDMSIINGGAAASESELQSLTSSNNNIIHIAAKHGQAEFIEESLKKFSRANLINQQNINGDTPLHVAVRHGEKVAAKLLAAHNPSNLLIAQNEDGDTPLHIALKYGYIDLACDLSERPESLSLINRSKETPLHLLIRCMPTVVKAVVEQPASSLQMGMLNSNGVSSFPSSYFIDNTLESLLRHFLSSYQDAACLRDAEGLTPLLRAAHYGFFMAVEIILKLCPESVDVYDPKGRTVLHYVHFAAFMILQDLFKIPEIDALKNVKDCEGNTPAHLAVFNGDLLLIKVLHESMADFSLKNNEHISAEELIESHEGFFGKMEEAMFNSFTGIRIEKELYEAAAVKGDVTLFDRLETTTNISGREFRYDVAMLLSRTTNGSTILHLATQNSNSAFVKKTLKHFPTLLLSRNYNGDTVYHIAARLKDPAAEVMVSWFNDYYRLLKVMKSEPEDVICYTPPWITKNSKGNTAIHEAMRVSNYNIAVELLHMASSLSADTNNAGETALHVYARYATYTVEEKLETMVRRLMFRSNTPAYQKDEDGMTPVMRAAQSGRIRLALHVLHVCPESMEILDSQGRTFLHHLNIRHLELVDGSEDPANLCEEIFDIIPGVDRLRTAQDEDGNTPLHLAVKSGKLVTAKFLMQRCLKSETQQELTIINNDGCSIFDLLASQPPDFKEIAILSQKYVKEIVNVKKIMDKELYMAALQGDVDLFNKVDDHAEHGVSSRYNRSYFLTRTPDGSNIIHIALRPGKVDTTAFIDEALNRFPSLIFETDANGDTPLHIAAKWNCSASVNLLWNISDYCQKAWEEKSRYVFVPPWKTKNLKGNMVIHEALCTNNMYAAKFLVNEDPDPGALYVNDAGETPLHVLARCSNTDANSASDNLDFLEILIPNNISVVYMRDNEGLTPLLRASKSGRIQVALAILEHCPQSAQLRDPSGRTFLHLLCFDLEYSEPLSDNVLKSITKQLFKFPEVEVLRTVQDCDGNSPLQYATKTGNSITARILAQRCFVTEERSTSERPSNRLFEVTHSTRTLKVNGAKFSKHSKIVRLLRKFYRNISTS